MPQTAAGQSEPPESDWARRVSRARWRDPRLILGVLLVVVSVVAGARLLAAADDYAEVWSAARDLPAGSPLQADDLQVRQVRFAEQAGADRYVAADVAPVGAVLSRPLAAGELLPRAALEAPRQGPVAELPVGVADDSVPGDLSSGDVVDIWVVPEPAAATGPASAGRTRGAIPLPAERVLTGVVVLNPGATAAPLSGAGNRTIVVGLSADDATQLPSVLARLTAGRVVVVRVGG